jgi:hypothetical protein
MVYTYWYETLMASVGNYQKKFEIIFKEEKGNDVTNCGTLFYIVASHTCTQYLY